MSSEVPAVRPEIRVIHHMARTGGTVICRCLASMRDIVLLSEIHPLGVRMFNPLEQAHTWYGLLTSEDMNAAESGKLNFVEAIQLISQRCLEQGKTLVLRDWSHLDFTGVPFVQPQFRSLLVESLRHEFTLIRHATVRHPLDQWLSLARQQTYRKQLSPFRFLKGCNEFADLAVGTGFNRYEDFTKSSSETLQSVCNALKLGFDADYAAKWQSYTNITGDVLPGRAGKEIATLDRQPADPAEVSRFRALPEYQATIEKLAYQDG